MYGGKAISTNVFFFNVATVSQKCHYNRELLPFVRNRESIFANIEISCRNKKLFGKG